MTSKRDLKKFIRYSCGAAAAEIVLARAAFPTIERNAVSDIIRDLAELQDASILLVNVSYDKTPGTFANIHEYRTARSRYYRAACHKLLTDFDAKLGDIVKKMNAALPDDVRATLKQAASTK